MGGGLRMAGMRWRKRGEAEGIGWAARVAGEDADVEEEDDRPRMSTLGHMSSPLDGLARTSRPP